MKQSDFESVDAHIILYLNTQRVLRNKLIKMGLKNVYVISDIMNLYFKEITKYNDLLSIIEKWIKQGCTFDYYRYPIIHDVINKNEIEMKLYEEQIIPDDYRKNFNKYEDLLRDVLLCTMQNESLEDINKYMVNLITPIIKKPNALEMKDVKSKYINIINGHRVTTNIPEYYVNNVYVMGPSWAFGKYARDAETIPSVIQRFINELGNHYKVENHGVPGAHWTDLMSNFKNLKIKKGDKIILIDNDNNLESYLIQHNVHVYNNDEIVQRPHNHGEIFVDNTHLNTKGDSLLADKIFKKCFTNPEQQKRILLQNINNNQLEYELCILDKEQMVLEDELNSYIEKLPSPRRLINGAIVMNCNPFTKGHRYLIEQAAGRVDNLYIFVVEEDKSYFPFKDRIELVKAGVADMKNVTVLASGKFMISATTFPEYFTKEDQKDVVIDASNDLRIFSEQVAPKLEITIRFAGEEPNDPITAQYNQEMARILPEYGIDFVEIPRKTVGDTVISASIVRELLKNGELNEIHKIVPETTFTYLKENIKIFYTGG